MNKIGVGIGVGIILAIAGVSIFLNQRKESEPMTSDISQSFELSPTPKLTIQTNHSDWKEYSNKKNGYTIHYPPEVSYEEYTNGDVRFYLLSDGKNNNTPTGLKDHLEILVRTGNSTETAAKEELVGQAYENVSFNNAVGIKMNGDNLDYYLSPKDKNTPILRLTTAADYSGITVTHNEKSQKLFKDMIATFTFKN